MLAKRSLLGLFVLSAIFCLSPADTSSAQRSGVSAGIKPAFRRLTESQYRRTVGELFGSSIKINARFEPEKREEGLMAIGNAELSLTSSGFEQYFALAGSIADQVLDPRQRVSFVPCSPTSPDSPDDACARQFISKYGERLFRRPLAESEITSRARLAASGAEKSGDFYAGLKLALSSLLVAPEFLFRVERAEADPSRAGQYRLDAYSKVSRLSFLLWDAGPDEELLGVARSGAIHSESGLKQQVTRMISSPRLENGMRAFFADMLQLDGFENLVKDPTIYPKFNQNVSDSAKEQTLRTVVDLLVTKRRDYREIFTSNETFLNRPLAAVYRVPYASTAPWAAYTFPQESGRSGILTQVSFLALFAHPGTSSPTKRGIKVLEIFLGESTPEPPANVDFSKVQDSAMGTVRGRLLDHMSNKGCIACHKRTDPPGLSLEHFDGLGQLRTLENGVTIDVTAEFDGKKFNGAQGLGRMLYDDQRVPESLVRNVYLYGVGRKFDSKDESFLAEQTKSFIRGGYRLDGLLRQLVSSHEFFKVAVPEGLRSGSSKPVAQQSTEGVSR